MYMGRSSSSGPEGETEMENEPDWDPDWEPECWPRNSGTLDTEDIIIRSHISIRISHMSN